MKISILKVSAIITLFTFSIDAQNLKVASGGLLYISPSSTVFVGENSSIDSNGQLIMDSVSNDFSDFYVTGTSSGLAEYRHYTASVATRDLVSPPVSGQLFSQFVTNNQGKIAEGTMTVSSNMLYGPLNNLSADGYEEYSPTSSETLVAAKGYRAASLGAGGQTLSYNGILTTSDTPIALSFGLGRWKRSNLIGNPFSTHLDTEMILGVMIANAGVDSKYKAMYFYNGSDTDFPWETVNFTNVTNFDLLTPGQAFVILGTPQTSSITIPSSARRVSLLGQDNSIQGRLSNESSSFLKLKLMTQSLSYTTSIYFISPNGTRAFDEGYDAGSFGSRLGTHLVESSEGLNLSIQTLPLEDMTSEDYAIPVDVNLAAGEEATLSFSELNIPSGVSFYLDDTELNIQTLLTSESYTFTATNDLNGIGRFYIRTTANTFTTESTALNSVEVFSMANSKNITVKGQLVSDSILKIYDIRGRLLSSHLLESNQTEHKIDVSNVSSGVYVTHLNNQNQTKTTKLVIN